MLPRCCGILCTALVLNFTQVAWTQPATQPAAPVSTQPAPAPATQPAPPSSPYLNVKTFFQTNSAFDPRLAIATDGVVVHQHGADLTALANVVNSWGAEGYQMGRMFFSDSDATNTYWTGRWDGTPRPDEVERNAAGEPILCAGIRPYMLATAGWTRYLEEMALASMEAGAVAILPEEPLAHVTSGYEEAFKALWQTRYGRPWEAGHSSPRAHFLTAQLKEELYLQLVQRLGESSKTAARRAGRTVSYIIPVHSLYSNIAAQLVAPLGSSVAIPQIDGYVGQVWTGPVRWVSANSGWPGPAFFGCAYALYDYFSGLVRGTDQAMWLLVDPVEDDPSHSWTDYEAWYRHCVVAKLMQRDTAMYEVAPWPDRIFLPGGSTGGGTPAPEEFREIMLSVMQAQQEITPGGAWFMLDENAPTEGVGVVVSDTAMWYPAEPPVLAGLFGMLLPLIQNGVPVSTCVLERTPDAGYLDHFKVLVLSYDEQVPIDPVMNTAIATWVQRGGSLIVLGAGCELNDPSLWWTKQGTPDPLTHLMENLGIITSDEGETVCGKGHVFRYALSPRRFVDPKAAANEYLPLVDHALRQAGVKEGLVAPGYFCMRRGPFLMAHALQKPLKLAGPLVDLLDPDLTVLDAVELTPGKSGLYRDVESSMRADVVGQTRPTVLHATHRLIEDQFTGKTSRIVIRGPAETPAVVRLHLAGRKPVDISAKNSEGAELATDSLVEGETLWLRFPNSPKGSVATITWP